MTSHEAIGRADDTCVVGVSRVTTCIRVSSGVLSFQAAFALLLASVPHGASSSARPVLVAFGLTVAAIGGLLLAGSADRARID